MSPIRVAADVVPKSTHVTRPSCRRAFVLAAMMLAVVGTTCLALPPPQPGRRVYDWARVISGVDRETLATELADIERATSAQVAIVTVPSLDGQTVEAYANALMNSWGIGARGRNNGVLLLVAPIERKARIEVGYGLEPILPDELCGRLLDTHAIPRFRTNDHSRGIRDTARAIVAVLREHPDEARGIPNSAPLWIRRKLRDANTFTILALVASLLAGLVSHHQRRRRHYPPLVFGVLLVGLVAATGLAIYANRDSLRPIVILSLCAPVLVLVVSASIYDRYGRRTCPKCRNELELLDARTEAKYLDAAQQLEEKLGSVDYDVWICHACLATHVPRYVEWLSGLSDCPRCGHRTCKQERRTISEATSTSTGLVEVHWWCVSCRYDVKHSHTTPMRTSLDDDGGDGWSGGFGGFGGSGGGSFGGGLSGGGGASRSW
jgi:uncharacterized protein